MAGRATRHSVAAAMPAPMGDGSGSRGMTVHGHDAVAVGLDQVGTPVGADGGPLGRVPLEDRHATDWRNESTASFHTEGCSK